MLYYTFTQPAQFAQRAPIYDPLEQYLIKREQTQRAALERQMLAELNTPALEFGEDAHSYHIVLSKTPSKLTRRFIGNYDLKQVGNELVISSRADNFYRAIPLPKDVDHQAEITYRTAHKGFQLGIRIPKVRQVRYVMVPNGQVSPHYLLARSDVGEAVQEQGEDSERSERAVCDAGGEPDQQPEQCKVEGDRQSKCQHEYEHIKQSPVCYTDAAAGARGSKQGGADCVGAGTVEDAVDAEREVAPADEMRNYETRSRKTVFSPNEAGFTDDESIASEGEHDPEVEQRAQITTPIRKVRSPTVEDLVDEEFA